MSLKSYNYLIYILSIVWLVSCKGKESKNADFLPVSRGAPHEVLLVIDSATWQGDLGEAVRETFMKAIPGLPQPEPYFDLKRVSPLSLNQVLLNSKNILYVATLNDNTPENNKIKSFFTEGSIQKIKNDPNIFMYPKKNEFAKGQDVLYLFGNNKEELISNLEKNRAQVRSFFEKVEISRLNNKLYGSNVQTNITKALLKEHQFYLKVPFGYDKVPLDDSIKNFVWLRQLDPKIDKSVFVYYQNYTSESVFNPDSILELRSRIGRKYLADSKEVYMTKQDEIPVDFDTVTFNGKYAIKARGLWKLSNNSMGGPFLSYTFVDEDLGRLYYIEGYVYSPGEKKRPSVYEVDAILNTFRTEAENNGDSSSGKKATS